jgi:orotidine-5'-phosphate decarboxylase
VQRDPEATMTRGQDALCVALDGSDRNWLLATARGLAGAVGWVKIGLEGFTAHGPSLVREVGAFGQRVFLDLKLHDIPATVRRAAANCASTGAGMLTVHASGGRAMVAAAVEGARSAGIAKVVAVTVLTSLDAVALADLGLDPEPERLVLSWARLAQDSGVDGVVCSAREAAAVRAACGSPFVIVTPGVRPRWSEAQDQRRTVTPAEAIASGADVVVIGRPVTGAPSPLEAVRRVVGEMEAAG